MANDIIEAYIEEDIKLQIQENNEFSKSTEYVKDLEEEHEKLISGNSKVPKKEIADRVSTTMLEIDLSLVALMKSTSHKLLKLEKFLSKIEDIIFNDNTLEELDKGKLLQLYGQTRIMRGELLKSLNELREKVDTERLEGQIKSLNIQNNKNEITSLDEIVEKILSDDNFVKESLRTTLNEIDKIKGE
jgi:predicted RNA-binding protein with EMAP domain